MVIRPAAARSITRARVHVYGACVFEDAADPFGAAAAAVVDIASRIGRVMARINRMHSDLLVIDPGWSKTSRRKMRNPLVRNERILSLRGTDFLQTANCNPDDPSGQESTTGDDIARCGELSGRTPRKCYHL